MVIHRTAQGVKGVARETGIFIWCEYCWIAFEARSKTQKYCSSVCAKRASKRRNVQSRKADGRPMPPSYYGSHSAKVKELPGSARLDN